MRTDTHAARRLGVVLAVAAATLSVIDPPPARADGCGPGLLGSATKWKDRNAIFDFAAACNWHDRCYGARGYGYDPVRSPGRAAIPYPREWCDSGFHQAMRKSCDARRGGSAKRTLCIAVADSFHALVRAFGERWYRKADGHRARLVLVWP